ncbi:MAG TPA: hypothetical protein VFV90_00025 [Usitatibacter sp.]|nr:hypothetical protein [Usitatibacter sp.]
MSDNIERLLRHDARIEVPDDGFTTRVMGALPKRERRERTWLRPVLVMGSALAGSVLAVALAPDASYLLQGFEDLVRLKPGTSAAIGGLALCGALLLSGLVLVLDD